MTTESIKTEVGNIPSPSNWANDGFTVDDCGCDETPSVGFLEKAIVDGGETVDGKVSMKDITKALKEYERLYKADIASPAELLTLSRAFPNNRQYTEALKKQKISDDDKLVIGGPASIELVDREGHLITTNALDKAFDKYMANFRTRNAMVLHSDVQVGWALPAYISKSGQIFKSGVNGNGLFFITELRNDTKISKKVSEQIHSGKLKSYSIAGSALKTKNIQKGLQDVMQVDELELAEVTVCEKGVNQAASFEIIKSENAATKSCIDGSCLITKEHEHEEPKKEVELMFKSDGEIDFTQSFMNFIQKEMPQSGIDAFPLLYSTQARQEEHHRLLDKYGFPGELEPEYARNTPVIEDDPSPGGSRYVPWAVNEAGSNLGRRFYDEALTTPQLGGHKKRGVIEGGNSYETPVSERNTAEGFSNLLSTLANRKTKKAITGEYSEMPVRLSKSDDFFNWMAREGNHIYKESCGCESCFQKSADYKGTIQRPTNFLV